MFPVTVAEAIVVHVLSRDLAQGQNASHTIIAIRDGWARGTHESLSEAFYLLIHHYPGQFPITFPVIFSVTLPITFPIESTEEDRWIEGRGTLIMIIHPSDADKTRTYQDVAQNIKIPIPPSSQG